MEACIPQGMHGVHFTLSNLACAPDWRIQSCGESYAEESEWVRTQKVRFLGVTGSRTEKMIQQTNQSCGHPKREMANLICP